MCFYNLLKILKNPFLDVIHVFSEYNTVNKGIVVKLYPDESMRDKINQNIGNARFTWNKLLQEYQETFNVGDLRKFLIKRNKSRHCIMNNIRYILINSTH